MDKQSVPCFAPPSYTPQGFAPQAFAPQAFAPPPSYASAPPPTIIYPVTVTPAPAPQQPPVLVVRQGPTFGSTPQSMTCPQCNLQISTRIETRCSTKTHLAALVLCLLGCILCAPCVYCCKCCLRKKHYCPGCNAYLGSCDR